MTKQLMGDGQRHEWFEVYVGCCTSGSIRPKGAAARNLGVTRTDQWFTMARNCTAGMRMPTSNPQWLVKQGQTPSEERFGLRSSGPRGVLRTAAEALQSTGTAGGPCAYQDRGAC